MFESSYVIILGTQAERATFDFRIHSYMFGNLGENERVEWEREKEREKGREGNGENDGKRKKEKESEANERKRGQASPLASPY